MTDHNQYFDTEASCSSYNQNAIDQQIAELDPDYHANRPCCMSYAEASTIELTWFAAWATALSLVVMLC